MFALKSKKLLAVILAIVMIFSAIPTTVVGAIGSNEKTLYLTLPKYYSTGSGLQRTLEEIKEVAATLSEGFKNFEDVVDISEYGFYYNQHDINTLVLIMSGYIPESFHVDNGFGIQYNDLTDQITGIIPNYLYTKPEYDAMMAKCNAKADEILADIKDNPNLGDVEKALLIHDRIALLCQYDYENYSNNSVPAISHKMYGVLGNGVAVCQGYAMTYGWLLDKVGIKNEYVSSDTLNHAWNIVYINNIPYHVDVTYDDPVWDITGRVTHINFLRSTEGIKSTGHDANDFNSTPTDTTYDNNTWQDSNTAFTLLGDEIYYICNVHDHIMRYSDNAPIYDITDHWWANEEHTSAWADQARLDTDGNVLLFSRSDGIYSLDPATITTPNDTIHSDEVLIISDTQTLSNEVINTDVYITSTGVATFNDVTVNGNVYCHGQLTVIGGSANNVYAYYWDLGGITASCNVWDGTHGLIKGAFGTCGDVVIKDDALNYAFESWGKYKAKVRLVWKATLTSYFSVFGFTYDGGYLIYDISLTPNFDENTKKLYESRIPYTPTPPGEFEAGDINGDTDITLDDVVMVAQHVAGWNTDIVLDAADVNGDNNITLDDVVLIAQYVAGWDIPELN